MENEIYFDGNNSELLRNLMEEYGNSEFPYHGENTEGEEIEIHICKDSIVYKTYQQNSWIRVNYYDEDGMPDGETFEGKWK